MNLLFLCIAGFILLCIVIGYIRGFFRCAASLVGVILTIVLSAIIAPILSTILADYTNIDENIYAAIVERFELELSDTTLTRSQELGLIDELELPESIKNSLIANCNAEGYASLGVTTATQYVASSLTSMAMRGVAYALTSIIVFIIVLIVVNVMNIASYIPIVSGINHVGGAIFGACHALIFIWLFLLVVTLCAVFEWASAIITMVDESTLLSWIYNSNVFLKIVGSILL